MTPSRIAGFFLLVLSFPGLLGAGTSDIQFTGIYGVLLFVFLATMACGFFALASNDLLLLVGIFGGIGVGFATDRFSFAMTMTEVAVFASIPCLALLAYTNGVRWSIPFKLGVGSCLFCTGIVQQSNIVALTGLTILAAGCSLWLVFKYGMPRLPSLREMLA